MDRLPVERYIDILLELDDDYLMDMCSTSTLFQTICTEEYFWKRRTKMRYSPFLHLKNIFSKWKDFYQTLSQKTAYVIIQGNSLDIVNNVHIAYKMILNSIMKRTHLLRDELP